MKIPCLLFMVPMLLSTHFSWATDFAKAADLEIVSSYKLRSGRNSVAVTAPQAQVMQEALDLRKAQAATPELSAALDEFAVEITHHLKLKKPAKSMVISAEEFAVLNQLRVAGTALSPRDIEVAGAARVIAGLNARAEKELRRLLVMDLNGEYMLESYIPDYEGVVYGMTEEGDGIVLSGQKIAMGPKLTLMVEMARSKKGVVTFEDLRLAMNWTTADVSGKTASLLREINRRTMVAVGFPILKSVRSQGIEFHLQRPRKLPTESQEVMSRLGPLRLSGAALVMAQNMDLGKPGDDSADRSERFIEINEKQWIAMGLSEAQIGPALAEILEALPLTRENALFKYVNIRAFGYRTQWNVYKSYRDEKVEFRKGPASKGTKDSCRRMLTIV